MVHRIPAAVEAQERKNVVESEIGGALVYVDLFQALRFLTAQGNLHCRLPERGHEEEQKRQKNQVSSHALRIREGMSFLCSKGRQKG
jgi:hypothetical protein